MTDMKIFVALLISVACALAAPVYVQPTHNQVFNIDEDDNFTYLIQVTDNPTNYPIIFTDDSQDPDVGFFCFRKKQYNASSSMMNFSCVNDYVGSYKVIISATNNISDPPTSITVYFNVSNTNDPPAVYDNSSILTVAENSTMTLWLEIYDDDLRYGDYMNFTWYLDGRIDARLFSYINTTNMSYANYTPLIEMFDAGIHNVTSVATDSGNVSISNTWLIDVQNVNRPPVFNLTITNRTWYEDTNITDNITLFDHFYDLDTNGTKCEIDTGNCITFDYSIISGNESVMTIVIDANSSKVSFYPAQDWFGEINVTFEASDLIDSVFSNVVTIRVDNINDAPRIDPIGNKSTRASTYWRLQVNATDVESDPITYYLYAPSIPRLTINQTTGKLVLESESADTGNHTVNITASDGNSNTSIAFNLEVLPNERPVIIPVGNKSSLQHEYLKLIINATDADGDNLTIWTNSSLLGNGTKINETSMNYSFVPRSQSLIGNYSVRAYVADIWNSTNTYDFILEIRDKPMPPNMYPVQVFNNQIKVNLSIDINVRAFDEDGDIQEFSDNTSLFNITTLFTGNMSANATARISFTPNTTGYHLINISVNDSRSQYNWTILILNITNNRPPHFDIFNDIVCEENEMCNWNIFADDDDWQDTVIYTDNATDWNINPLTGQISWMPMILETYYVNITATDGEVLIWDILFVNITPINDPPYFMENITNLTDWKNVKENQTSIIYINAADEEFNRTGEKLDLYVDFLNFTNIINVTTNISSLFDFTLTYVNADNTTTGILNFTPGQAEVGTYWVNISVSDNNTVVSEIFKFNVQNVNNRLRLNWSVDYYGLTYGDANYSEWNATENTSIIINTYVFDPDYDSLTYVWTAGDRHLGSYKIGSGPSLDYTIPFTAFPNFSISVVVSDPEGASDSAVFFFDAENVNRNITFGRRDYDFGGGINNNTVVKDPYLVQTRNGSYYANYSYYITESLDFKTTSLDMPRIEYYNVTYSNNDTHGSYWQANTTYYTPNGTNVSVAVKNYTHVDGQYNVTLYTETTNGAFSSIWAKNVPWDFNSSDYRYMKLRFDINNSNNTVTPGIYGVQINYGIRDLAVTAETEFAAWIDLNHFFDDPDIDDDITYDYYFNRGANLVNVSILQGHFVRLTFVEAGDAELIFNATDPYNSTVESNVILINISSAGDSNVDDSDNSENSGQSSSSSSTRTETEVETTVEYKFRKQEVPISLDIIHPGKVDIYSNETIIVPIELRNNEKFDLTGLTLQAYTENDGLDLMLDKTEISQLPREGTIPLSLTMSMNKVYDSYEVYVEVNVSDPTYTDTAKILVSTLKKTREDPESQKLKLSFVSDLLSRNEECAELSEYISRARQYYASGQTEKGDELLDQFVNDCRILISGEPFTEKPDSFVDMLWQSLTGSTDRLVMSMTVLALLTMIVIITLTVAYKKI